MVKIQSNSDEIKCRCDSAPFLWCLIFFNSVLLALLFDPFIAYHTFAEANQERPAGRPQKRERARSWFLDCNNRVAVVRRAGGKRSRSESEQKHYIVPRCRKKKRELFGKPCRAAKNRFPCRLRQAYCRVNAPVARGGGIEKEEAQWNGLPEKS